jgi:thiol-disulfide isomerase/thioredoxin
MVQQTESVVTPERFAKGVSYAEYEAKSERFGQRMKDNYAGTEVAPEDAKALKDLMAREGGPAKIMVITEDWCPDCYRGVPVFARIGEASGMEVRIFARDENKDIMSEFLHNGEFESIPTVVFYTKDHRYIAHWIERPALANEQMREMAPMYARMRKPDKTPEEAEQAKNEYIAFQNGPVWGGWRTETIKEVIRLLDDKTR